ncbi:MAG: MGMT family protein [Myxococcota bacterium]|nr:MGMT family protein [Myxococcota bacterium]
MTKRQCGDGDPARQPTPFEVRVAAAIRAIPKGSTLSYSGVALEAGKPGAARAVVRAMKNLRDLPWWRVIRRDGTLAAEVAKEQSKRLRREGVKLVNGNRLARTMEDPARPAARSPQ